MCAVRGVCEYVCNESVLFGCSDNQLACKDSTSVYPGP
jgi:hypothetical protein